MPASWPAEEYERRVLDSLNTFGTPSAPQTAGAPKAKGDNTPVFRRRPALRGPLEVFGYDYFADHAKAAGVPTPKLLSYQGEWGSGGEYAYEALNLADGRHTAQQITDELSAEYGPLPTDLVIEYLKALKSIGIVD